MFDVINHTLSAAVASSGTFTVSYPAGKSAATYTGAHKHKMYALQTEYTAPNDFTLTFGASSITVTWGGDTTLPAAENIRLQVDRQGNDKNDPQSAIVNTRVVRSQLSLLDLGSPLTADADGVAASQSVAAAASFTINGALASNGKVVFDTPRNVVAAWTTTSILTITGKDVDGNTVVEKSSSGTSHTGSKAFKEVTSVSSSASITSATVGSGTVLGLPCYIPSASNVLMELKNGVALPRRPGVVYLSGKILEAAVDAGTPLNIVSPVAGYIRKLTTIASATVTTGGDFTVEVNTVAVAGLTVTVANSAVEGEVDSDTATLGDATSLVAVGDRIEIIPSAAFNASADFEFILEIDTTAAGMLTGTFVAGVTSEATATTGDTRGTYTPLTAPDGVTAYALLASVPGPDDRGVPQYTG